MTRIVKHVEEGGRKVALVPLGRFATKGVAVVDEDDLILLDELGLSMCWNRNSRTGTVFAPAHKASGGNVQVARVLLDLGPGENVHYRNGSPSDLRRQNLTVNPNGSATRRDRDFLTPKHERRHWGPAVTHTSLVQPEFGTD